MLLMVNRQADALEILDMGRKINPNFEQFQGKKRERERKLRENIHSTLII